MGQKIIAKKKINININNKNQKNYLNILQLKVKMMNTSLKIVDGHGIRVNYNKYRLMISQVVDNIVVFILAILLTKMI